MQHDSSRMLRFGAIFMVRYYKDEDTVKPFPNQLTIPTNVKALLAV